MKLNLFLLFLLIGIAGCKKSSSEGKKPNILFCIMDDAGIQMNAYGYDWCKAPVFNKIAKNGILFTNAYTPNAKCALSRSTIITGRNSWQLEDAANHVLNFPAKFKTFPEVLRDNGYVTAKTGKGWAPRDPRLLEGKVRLLIGEAFNAIKTKPWAKGMGSEDYAANFDDFLNKTDQGKPWFFWYGAREPHRHYEYGSGHWFVGENMEDIDSMPAFWTENEIIRNEMLHYAFEVEYADSHLGFMIENLEKRGLLENTIIVFTSDHGMPFPCGKAHEYSNHVPMAIMWTKSIKNSGRTVTDMVCFIDLAPTFLELAGIPIKESGMHSSPGRSLTDIFYSKKEDQFIPERDILLIGKERHDYSRLNNQGFPIRGIVSDDYLYFYNYYISLWPAVNSEIGYLDIAGSPTKTKILRQFRIGENDLYWKLSMGKREAHEEFFNITKDSECMNNLADTPEFAKLKEKMKTRMENMLNEQQDPRQFGNRKCV